MKKTKAWFLRKLIPTFQRLYKSISKDKYANFYYSQYGEDYSILELAQRIGLATGFYVDVGAHHPFHFSTTAALHQRGWRGMNIDASEKAIDLFKQLRPDDLNVNTAVSDQDEKITFYSFGDSPVDTADVNHARVWAERLKREPQKRELTARSLNSILELHLPHNQRIDLLTIDLEGLDHKTIRSFDIEKYSPSIICIEINELDFESIKRNTTYKYLIDNKYRLKSINFVTAVFLRSDLDQK